MFFLKTSMFSSILCHKKKSIDRTLYSILSINIMPSTFFWFLRWFLVPYLQLLWLALVCVGLVRWYLVLWYQCSNELVSGLLPVGCKHHEVQDLACPVRCSLGRAWDGAGFRVRAQSVTAVKWTSENQSGPRVSDESTLWISQSNSGTANTKWGNNLPAFFFSAIPSSPQCGDTSESWILKGTITSYGCKGLNGKFSQLLLKQGVASSFPRSSSKLSARTKSTDVWLFSAVNIMTYYSMTLLYNILVPWKEREFWSHLGRCRNLNSSVFRLA